MRGLVLLFPAQVPDDPGEPAHAGYDSVIGGVREIQPHRAGATSDPAGRRILMTSSPVSFLRNSTPRRYPDAGDSLL